MLRKMPVHCSSICITDRGLLVVKSNNYFSINQPLTESQLLLYPNMCAKKRVRLAVFPEKTNILFKLYNSQAFLGLDNKLMVSNDFKTWKTVLETRNKANAFWHMTQSNDGTLFVQEYAGVWVPHTKTSIYRSPNQGKTWEKVIDHNEIDKKALHFHSIQYDRYRNVLIATLGDTNIVKIAISGDLGNTWKKVYTVPYQVLPIVVCQNYVVFGMDSGITKGIVLWYPKKNRWRPISIKYVGNDNIADCLQLSDLKYFNNVFLATTGNGSLIYSYDLRSWQLLHTGCKKCFEANMISNKRNNIVAVCTGNKIMIINIKELTKVHHVDYQQYPAIVPRMLSYGQLFKLRLLYTLTSISKRTTH